MPLARILTAYPERAETLARELKDQGYDVEFLSPEKAGMLRADLEIDFEICDQKVVLRRAAELANKLHTDIAVSPEALPANFVATESEIYVSQNQNVEVPSQMPDPYVETFLAQGERTGQIRNLENSDHMVSLPPDMLAENTQASASAEIVPPEQAHSQQPLVEPMAAASVNSEPMQARSEDPARMEDRARVEEPIRTIDVPIVPDPERHAEGTYGFETHGFENQSPGRRYMIQQWPMIVMRKKWFGPRSRSGLSAQAPCHLPRWLRESKRLPVCWHRFAVLAVIARNG